MTVTKAIGQTVASGDLTHHQGAGFANVIAGTHVMPENGWVTRVEVRAGGQATAVSARLGLWGGDEATLLYAGPTQTWAFGLAAHGETVPSVPVKAGETLFRGFWRDMKDDVAWSVNQAGGAHHLKYVDGAIPDRYDNYQTWAGFLAGQLHYVPNRAPLKGSWVGATPSGTAGSLDPTFEGTLPHSPDEGGRDRSTLLHVKVYDRTNGTTPYDQYLSVEPQEAQNGRFSRKLFTHTAGHSYEAEFRHMDTWSTWSLMSARVSYTTAEVASKPLASYPAGQNVKTLTPNFRGTYRHPAGRPATAVRVSIFTPDGRIRHHHSETRHTGPNGAGGHVTAPVAVSIASGAAYDLTWLQLFGSFTGLGWARGYSYVISFRDNLGNWGVGGRFLFSTNTSPYAPTDPSPSNGEADAQAILTCKVADKDGDDLTQVVFTVSSVAGTVLAGYPKAVAGPFRSGTTVALNASADLVKGTRYRWDAYATDGTLEGPRTEPQEFVFDDVPQSTLLVPSRGGVVNTITTPTADYDLDNTRTTAGGPVGTVRSVVPDEGSDSSDYVWEISKTDGGAVADFYVNEKLPAMPGERRFVAVELKIVSGAIDAQVFADCFGANGTYLSSVLVQAGVNSLRTLAPITSSFVQYGGLTDPLPANTVFVRGRVLVSAGSVGVFRADKWMLVRVPSSLPAADFNNLRKRWFGYFDGGAEGFGKDGSYYWAGPEGLSQSIGINRLSEPQAQFSISYSSASNIAKKDDRLLIERWAEGAYRLIHDSGRVASARTEIPLPTGLVRNEGRYRVQVRVRDQNNLETTTGYLEFDVQYPGPPELLVRGTGVDEKNASISIEWERSAIPPETLSRIEIALSSPEEGEKMVGVTTDPEATSFTYHFPVSRREYALKVRQVQSVGPDEVQGRWSTTRASVDYHPYHFLKSVRDPTLALAFRFLAGETAERTGYAPVDEYEPLLASSNPAPRHFVGPHRYESGSFSVTLTDYEDRGTTAAEGREVAKALDLSDRFVCFLDHDPPNKNFAVLKDIGYSDTEFVGYVVDVSYADTDYSEDYLTREGGF